MLQKNKNNIPGFTVQVYREKVNCVAMLLRFFFLYVYYYTILKINQVLQASIYNWFWH